MATIIRGSGNALVEKLKTILDRYEQQHVGAYASIDRQNPVSIRIRIVDDAFASVPKAVRHDRVWDFISGELNDEEIQDVSMLLLLTPREQGGSLMNAEFENPVPSEL